MARSSSRDRIIGAALKAFSLAGEDVTIDSVARLARLTKQGVLYHFPDKSSLRVAMLETVLVRWEAHMLSVADTSLDTVGARIRAYARVSAQGDVVPGEAALFAQISSRPDEAVRYAEWVTRLFSPPPGCPTAQAARLNTAWLAANSLWSVLVSSKRRFDDAEVLEIVRVIEEMTEGL